MVTKSLREIENSRIKCVNKKGLTLPHKTRHPSMIMFILFFGLTVDFVLGLSDFSEEFNLTGHSHNITGHSHSKNFFIGNAYIVTTKPFLDPQIKIDSMRAGFYPLLFKAMQPLKELYNDRKNFSAEVLGLSYDSPAVQQMFTSHLTLGEIALIGSTRQVLSLIANDKTSKESSWSLILEDDARMNWDANKPAALVKRSLHQIGMKGYGLVYLGICDPICKDTALDGSLGINCKGACTHAYAVTKARARTYFKEMYGESTIGLCSFPKLTDVCDLDTSFEYRFDKTMALPTNSSIENSTIPFAYVIGLQYNSPEWVRHNGLFFQCCRSAATKQATSALSFIKDFI